MFRFFLYNHTQIFGCLSDKSGGIRINAMPMKDMNPGRNASQSFERQKDSAVIFFIIFYAMLGFFLK